MATITGILPLGGFRDDAIADEAAIDATKFVHQTSCSRVVIAESSSVTAGSFPLLIVQPESALIVDFEACLFAAPTGDRFVTVDLQKATAGGAFVTIMSNPVTITDTLRPRIGLTSVLFDVGLVAGDILRVVVATGGATGTTGAGLLVTLTTRDPGGSAAGLPGSAAALTSLQADVSALLADVDALESAVTQLQIDVLSESLHVERDLGCVDIDTSSSFDCYALLANAFLYDSRVQREILFPAKRFRINSTLHTTYRGGLTVRCMGGMATPASENQYDFGGPTPAIEFGGPSGALVWGGAAGGTMVQLNGNQGNWINLPLQGQMSATDPNAVQYAIDYDLGADIGFYMRDGAESDLAATPPYASPGRWTFYNACMNALRYGFKAGGSGVVNANHADHTCFSGITQFNWCDVGFWLAGPQSVQFQFQMIVPLQIRNVFQVDAGGQIAVSSGRLQGVSDGFNYPTWIYFNGGEINHGRFQFKSLHVDGTLVNGFRIVDYNDSSPPYGLLATIEIDGFSTDLHGYSDASYDAKAGPIFRLGGPMHLTVRNGYAIEERSLEMHGMSAGGWFGPRGAVETIPWAVFHDCNFSDISVDHDPVNIVRTGVGESSGKRVVRWFNSRHLRGNPIPDDVDEVL